MSKKFPSSLINNIWSVIETEKSKGGGVLILSEGVSGKQFVAFDPQSELVEFDINVWFGLKTRVESIGAYPAWHEQYPFIDIPLEAFSSKFGHTIKEEW